MSRPSRAATLRVRGHTFHLRWNLQAIATLEELTGQNALQGITVTARNVALILWAALDADAAARDEEPPMSRRQFFSVFESDEEIGEAFKVATELVRVSGEEANPPKPAGARRRARARGTRPSRSNGSTSAEPSI